MAVPLVPGPGLGDANAAQKSMSTLLKNQCDFCAVLIEPKQSWGAFASGHVDGAAHVRADGWPGPASGLRAWAGPARRKFDANGLDASLPAARHVISNFKSWATGTFHGLSTAGPRAYADEFSRIFALRVRRHDGPDRRLLPGVLPPRPAARGGLRPQPPAAPARGRPRRGRRPDILRP